MKRVRVALLTTLLLFQTLLNPLASHTTTAPQIEGENGTTSVETQSIMLTDAPSEEPADATVGEVGQSTDVEKEAEQPSIPASTDPQEKQEATNENQGTTTKENIEIQKAAGSKENSEVESAEKTTEENSDEKEVMDVTDFTPAKASLKTINVRATSGLTAKKLLINPEAIANNMKVTTNSGLKPVKKTVAQQPVGSIGGSVNDYKTKSYELFKGTGSQALVYDNLYWRVGDKLSYNGKEEVITVNYDFVGYVDIGDDVNPKYIPVSAKMVISNIILGSGPRWTQIGVAFDFSNNFYSGMLYQYVQSMDIDITFYEQGTDNAIAFDGTNGTFSFLSLNGYGCQNWDEWGLSSLHNPGRTDFYYDITYEFAGSRQGVQGLLSENTKLVYHVEGTKPTSNGTYYMEGYPQFDDYLGGATFLDSGVTFPLSGTTHKFKLGSTYGYTWNSFMSASVQPAKHTNPTKTVQPLKNSNGNDSGYSNRYDNDYDRFWDLSSVYWKNGHKPDNLANNVYAIDDRYQKTNESFYYFINQNAINLYTESLVVPKRIKFEDTLPEGVTLANNSLNDLTLYNVDGSTITLKADEWSYNPTTRKLVVYLSEANTKLINNKIQANAKEFKEIGDISLRVKAKVTKEAVDDPTKNTMTNEASTTFEYNSKSFTQNSNKVQTAVRKMDVEKVWNDEDNKYELRSDAVTVKLQYKAKSSDAWKDVANSQVSLNNQNQWKYTYGSNILGSGKYQIVEVNVPSNYAVSYIDCSKNQDNEKCEGKDYKWFVENTLEATSLDITKVSSNGDKLTGVEFKLYSDKDKKLDKQTTNDKGTITFDGLIEGSYYIQESKALDGYRLDQTKYNFEVKKVNGKVGISYGNNWPQNNTFKNEKINYKLTILKVDAYNNEKVLEGAEFELYSCPDNSTDLNDCKTLKDNGTTNSDGKAIFENLSYGTYKLVETKAPNGYRILTKPIEVKVTGDNEHITFTVENSKNGWNLPHAGGIGPGIFSIIGAIVMISVLFMQMKKRKVVH